MTSQYTRKIRPGALELDPNESVLIVNVETQIIDANNTVIQTKNGQKRIKLKAFNESSDVQGYADEIVKQVKYIHPKKVGQVVQLLEQLRCRQSGALNHHSNASKAKPFLSRGAPLNTHVTNSLPLEALPQHPNLLQAQEQARAEVQARLEREALERTRAEVQQRALRKKEAEAQAHAEEMQRLMKIDAQRQQQQEEQRRRQQRERLEREQEVQRQKYAEEKERQQEISWRATMQKSVRPPSREEEISVRQVEQIQQRIPPFGDEDGNNVRSVRHQQHSGTRSGRKKNTKASMKKLDTYFTMLYEDNTADKLKGCQMILQLVQNPNNLEHFIDNDTLLGALSRVLAEDRKKSTELATTILEIFFCFSSFKELHDILLRNRIGDTTMRIIDLELKRYQAQQKAKNHDPSGYKHFLAKQEKLLYVCFYILLNLAEDLKIEAKMTARNINENLVEMLQRDDSGQNTTSKDVASNDDERIGTFLDELHLLVITFLKKLSVFVENKDEMRDMNIVPQLRSFFFRNDPDLRVAVMSLVYNLSFDPDLRKRILQNDLTVFFVHALRAPQARAAALRVLYNLSTDEESRMDFCMKMRPSMRTLTELIISCPEKFVDTEMIALAVNLTVDPLCCKEICGGNDNDNLLQQLVKRVHHTLDPNLMKLLRNISEHDDRAEWCGRPLFARYLHQFVGMMTKTPLVEFLVEVTACMNNTQLPDYMYSELIQHHNLLPFIMKNLVPGFVDDDVILEMVMLVGTLAMDPLAAPILANPRLVILLYDLLTEKQDDEDMMVQITFTITKLLVHDESQRAVANHQHLADLLLELVVDSNKDVRKYANISLDIIMSHDDMWHEKIREKRFEMCNREWLDAITSGSLNVDINHMVPEGASHPLYSQMFDPMLH